MTEEQIKQKAEEYAKENYCDEVRATARNAYLDCARLKEKRITELQQKNNKLLDVINNQDVKIADLEKQIEKMKCCQNCEIFTYHNSASCGEPILIDKSHGTYVCDKWKLKE